MLYVSPWIEMDQCVLPVDPSGETTSFTFVPYDMYGNRQVPSPHVFLQYGMSRPTVIAMVLSMPTHRLLMQLMVLILT